MESLRSLINPKSRVNSSTLIEVIVSMVIISILAAVFFSFLTSLKRDNNLELKIKAHQAIDNLSKKAFSNSKVVPGELNFHNLKIITIVDSCNFKNVREINFKAFNSSKKCIAHKTIYLTDKP